MFNKGSAFAFPVMLRRWEVKRFSLISTVDMFEISAL